MKRKNRTETISIYLTADWPVKKKCIQLPWPSSGIIFTYAHVWERGSGRGGESHSEAAFIFKHKTCRFIAVLRNEKKRCENKRVEKIPFGKFNWKSKRKDMKLQCACCCWRSSLGRACFQCAEQCELKDRLVGCFSFVSFNPTVSRTAHRKLSCSCVFFLFVITANCNWCFIPFRKKSANNNLE